MIHSNLVFLFTFSCVILSLFSFLSGGRNLLHILHGHASAGILWLPCIRHEDRHSYESTMEEIKGSPFEILEPVDAVDFDVSFDLSSYSYERSSNRSVYYPITGKLMDNGSDILDMSHRKGLLDALPEGADFSSLFSSEELKDTFAKARETGRAQTTIPFLFQDTVSGLPESLLISCFSKKLPVPVSYRRMRL